MTLSDDILAAIHHQEVRPVPYTLGFEGDVAERLDVYYGGKEWRRRLAPYMVTVGAVDTIRERPISATHTRDVFGGIWRHDRRPFHLEEPPLKEPSLKAFRFPDAEEFLPDPDKLRADALKACAEHPDNLRVIHMGWGIFEQSWRIRGFENALMDAIAEPEFYTELLDRLTDLYVTLVKFWDGVPADAFMFGDDWGHQRGVILGPDRWRNYIKPCWTRVYEAVHAQGKLAMSHSCGSVAEILPDIIEMGLDVLESVQPEAEGMHPYGLKQKWGQQICFWGCLGSQSTIPFGTPEEIRQTVQRLCREMGQGGGYILAPAKSLQPETPTENAAAIVEAFTNQQY